MHASCKSFSGQDAAAQVRVCEVWGGVKQRVLTRWLMWRRNADGNLNFT